MESQELLGSGDGSVTRAVLGELRTTFEQGQARTVNRILDGGSILTIFHEEAHGFRRRAHQNRSLTIADDIAILRAVDTVLAGKTTREGDKQLRLLPENFDSLSPKDQETAIDEGISRLMEAEVLRTRKGGGVRELPAGIISNNLAALSRVAGDKSVRKFRAFIRAMRAHFGLAIDRASEIRRGLEDGTISRADYEGYLKKLHGTGTRQAHDAEASNHATEFDTDSPLATSAFSVGDPSRLSRPVPALEISSDQLPGNRADWKNSVRQMIAEQLQRRSIDNRDTGQNIFFNSESKSQSVSKIRTEPAHRAALRIPSIVEEAIYIGHSPESKGKGDHVAGFDYFAIPLNLGGSEGIAWFNTKKRSGETANRGQFYQFGLLEKKVARTSQSLVEEPRVTLPEGGYSNAGPARTIASFVEEVKGLLPSASSFIEDPQSFSLGPAVPRLSEHQSQQVEDAAFENAKRSRVVNTDDIRPLIPGYQNANPYLRDVTYHKTASKITMRVLRRMAAEPPVTGKVLILAGGGGTGKSSVAQHFSEDVDFTFDTTLSNKVAAEALLNGIRANGREPMVLYVHRRFGTSFEHIIRRYLDEKSKGMNGAPRIIPLPLAYAAHRGARDVIFNLEGVPITIIDNNGKLGEFRQIALEQLTQDRYIQTHEPSGDRRIQGMATENSSAGEEVSRGDGSRGTGEDRQDYRGSETEALAEAEGARVIRRYQREGILTSAEVRAFFGTEFFPVRPTIVRTDGRGDRDLHETDPQSILKAIAGIETQVHGRADARTDGAQRRKHGRGIASGERLADWAVEHGRVLIPDALLNAVTGTPVGGGEHRVVEDIVSNRVVKVTKPGLFGAQGEDAGNYVLRWALHNLAFNSDVTFEGIVTFPGEHAPRAVISQPFVFGRDATPEEQTDFLTERGFHEVESGRWVHPVRGLVLWDTITPGNAIMTDEGVVPIDYQIDHAPTEELNRVRQQTGIGRNTSFSISNDPPLPSLNRRDP